MEIKEFSIEYVSDVAEIEKNCFSNPWNEKVIEEELKNDCSHIYVAVEKERAVGYAMLYVVCGEADIIRVAVLPEYRRQGIAEKLLLKSFEVNETDAVFLDVRESNAPAIRLYQSLGFADTGVRKNYYSNPTENAILMKKEFKNVEEGKKKEC
ncbi:MAG: ribosomal protein S18-alanine N-acetyltransferase [Eubacterium sp.]|nr:ribosomal protein S18-alanine N-acetyltransferase [Eubacterium sp.]